MNDEYLWTGAGRPDPAVEHLEQALRPYGHRPQPVRLHAPAAFARLGRKEALPAAQRSHWLGIAILCASCFVVSVFAWGFYMFHSAAPTACGILGRDTTPKSPGR
jgi:hypothetical protein